MRGILHELEHGWSKTKTKNIQRKKKITSFIIGYNNVEHKDKSIYKRQKTNRKKTRWNSTNLNVGASKQKRRRTREKKFLFFMKVEEKN